MFMQTQEKNQNAKMALVDTHTYAQKICEIIIKRHREYSKYMYD